MHRMRTADGLGTDLRQTDMFDVALLHHLGHRADGLFDRHIGIEPGRPVDIYRLDAAPLQRISEEILHPLWPAVIAMPVAFDVAQRAELDRDLHLVAVA